jgi:uncharacterized oxidoreductase
MPTVSAPDLTELTKAVLLKKGATDTNAQTVAGLLVRADLTGHESHGVVRLLDYVTRIDQGAVNPTATGRLVVDAAAIGVYEAERAFGQVAASAAMKIAIAKAGSHGVAAVGVRNAAHVGRMADYAMMAIEAQMIGITMATSARAVAPFGGTERFFNPSPLGVGIPAGSHDPFVLDTCMGVCAISKIEQRQARGESLPPGWIINSEGRPSVNPADYFNGGAILPIGGDVAFKGYGLAFMIDLLAGALTGGGCSAVTDFRGGNGVFMIVIDVARFRAVDAFTRSVDEVIAKLKASKTAPGVEEVMIPGEAGFRHEKERLSRGVPVNPTTWSGLVDLTRGLGVPMPEPVEA